MSLETWEKNRWIDKHSPTVDEIAALIETAEHAINQADSLIGLSPAWKMKMTYDTILCCARACLFNSGYRASKTGPRYQQNREHQPMIPIVYLLDFILITIPQMGKSAVRMVIEHEKDYKFQWSVIMSISSRIGCTIGTLCRWVRNMEVDTGMRGGSN